jgi:hypothetical protein
VPVTATSNIPPLPTASRTERLGASSVASTDRSSSVTVENSETFTDGTPRNSRT